MAAVSLIGPILEVFGKVIDRVVPDKAKAAEIQFETFKLLQSAEGKALEADVQLALGQLEVNKIEAAAPDLFRGGWRPFIGWTCGGGLFYQIIVRPIFGWVATNAWGWTEPPSLEMDTLLTLLFSMLGLGAYRTYERVKGKA